MVSIRKRIPERETGSCIPLSLRVRLSYLIMLFFILAGCLTAHAQDDTRRRGSRVIDDSTKQVYGPKTSRYYFEQDIFFNRLVYTPIDTAIRNFHRYNYVQRHNNYYEDLGNIGTAIRPVFYQVPDVIGVTSGFTAYDLYWDDEEIRYYDTKSPYSNIRAILGGKGRSMTRVTFSRNITPQWNFGFNYRTLLIDKQIQRSGKGDRNVRSTYYDIYTSYQSPDSAYRVMFNFRRNRHEADEYGGINDKRSTDDDPFEYQDYFFVNAQPNLRDAFSRDQRMNAHLYHQYEIGRALQIYHTFDRYRQGNQFNDGRSDNPYYDFFNEDMDTTATHDKVKFKYVRNEAGIKGNLLKLFYNGYYAIRDYTFTNNHIDTLGSQVSGVESYIGGRMSLHLDSIGEVTGWAELQDNGNYRIDGNIKSKWFQASVKQVQYSPTLLQLQYRGSHDLWENPDFSNVNVTELNGYLRYASKSFTISPGLTFTRLGNYIFFQEDVTLEDQQVLPIQSSGQQVIFSPELKLSATFMRHVSFSTQVIYTRMLDNPDNAIQIPELFVNAQLSYANIFFNGNLDMHAGVDVHYKSDYYPLGYDTPIQTFYVQHEREGGIKARAFPIIDVFFSARIKRGRIFFKYHNLMQAFSDSGYMPTARYPGQRNIIDFGFDWSFYD